MQRVVWAGLTSLAVSVLGMEAEAQVVPDNTLGAERSRVRADRIRGRDGIERDSDVIEGGAQRGSNLFHSFQQFDVPEGRGAYFGNPVDVQNIFSRVIGSDRSEILGRLGVLGNANLFFMNPNGILFGPNASLDVGGSFAATTANAIQFSEQGFF
nr:MAG: filamentous hemagglutinin N-terminal domain-containing protein [Leptolyngbya sp. IPPAS B-1204]